MLNRSISSACAAAFCLLFALGSAQAQLRAPGAGQPRGGSGLSAPAAESAPAPARPQSSKPAAKPAAASEPAGETAKSAGETASSDSVLQGIADCMLAGLPRGWTTAQVQVTELGADGTNREFEAKYFHTVAGGKPVAYIPCDPREPAMNVYRLNGALDADKRNWNRATLTLSSEGKFELKYDYP